jgi:hypothetical protein
MHRPKFTSEEATTIILEDGDEDDLVSLEWAIIGKVLTKDRFHDPNSISFGSRTQ